MDKMKKVKKKRKMAKNLTLHHWDSNPRFLNKSFPPKIWILREIRSIELTVLKKSRLYEKVLSILPLTNTLFSLLLPTFLHLIKKVLTRSNNPFCNYSTFQLFMLKNYPPKMLIFSLNERAKTLTLKLDTTEDRNSSKDMTWLLFFFFRLSGQRKKNNADFLLYYLERNIQVQVQTGRNKKETNWKL